MALPPPPPPPSSPSCLSTLSGLTRLHVVSLPQWLVSRPTLAAVGP